MNGTKANGTIAEMALLAVLWGAEEPEVTTKEVTNRMIAPAQGRWRVGGIESCYVEGRLAELKHCCLALSPALT